MNDTDRILGLPERDWAESADVEGLTRALRTSAGTQTLRPIQAAALKEAPECGGLFLCARVGAGKTLTALLLPTVLRLRNPIIVAPGKLVKDMEKAAADLRLHWQISRSIRVVSYQLISQPQRAEWLERQAPDGIICDEAHALKDPKNATCAKRIGRYLQANPTGKFACMTATTGPEGELLEYWHLLVWSLRKRAPVPQDLRRAKAWSRALEGTGDPAKLLGAQDREEAEELYRDRLARTPGVIISSDTFEAVPLSIEPVYCDAPEDTRDAYERLRNEWEAPDGWSLGDDQFQVAALARQLACGFYYRMDPRPSPEFLRRRKAWTIQCREVIDAGHADSEGQVKLMVRNGELPGATLAAWERAEAEHPMRHVVDWLSSEALEFAIRWARPRGIIWTQHLPFGRALEELTGMTFYSGDDDRDIHRDRGDRCVVATIQACGTGKNLQAFHQGLIMDLPANGGAWEQLLGRMHREGNSPATGEPQTRPVTYWYRLACREHVNAIAKATRGARKACRTLIDQKLYGHPVPSMSLQDHPAWFQAEKIE